MPVVRIEECPSSTISGHITVGLGDTIIYEDELIAIHTKIIWELGEDILTTCTQVEEVIVFGEIG